MGLTLGASVISFVELIYFLCILCKASIKFQKNKNGKNGNKIDATILRNEDLLRNAMKPTTKQLY